MKAQELYNQLNERELEREMAESFEGLRVIKVAVDENDEDVPLEQYISDYICEELMRNNKQVTKLEGIYLKDVIAKAIEAYRGGAR